MPLQQVITVLICTHNRRHDVLELLDSVERQITNGQFDIETLVIDNNSADGTREAVNLRVGISRAHIRYYFEPRQGKCHALNRGIAAARGHLIAIIDSDQLLPPEYLA